MLRQKLLAELEQIVKIISSNASQVGLAARDIIADDNYIEIYSIFLLTRLPIYIIWCAIDRKAT